jgi:hypothetical protein
MRFRIKRITSSGEVEIISEWAKEAARSVIWAALE